MPENKTLGASFDWPERLTVAIDSRYQQAVNEGIKFVASHELPIDGARAYAIYSGAALQSGLIQNWKCPTLTLQAQSEDEIDVAAVYWVGPLVHEWVEAQRKIPKVSFWRRLKLAWAVMRRTPRRNSS